MKKTHGIIILCVCVVAILFAQAFKGGDSTVSASMVELGDTANIAFKGVLATNGRVFAQTQEGKTLPVELGAKRLLPALEAAIVGMKQGETKEISLASDNAYGAYNTELVRTFPRSAVPADIDAKAGVVLQLTDKEGRSRPGIILSVTDDAVVVDLNHVLAGKDLVFTVTVEDIQKKVIEG